VPLTPVGGRGTRGTRAKAALVGELEFAFAVRSAPPPMRDGRAGVGGLPLRRRTARAPRERRAREAQVRHTCQDFAGALDRP